MEAYQGLAILATNMKSGLDDAFVRRLRFILTFPVPENADRQRIWERIFPSKTPLGDIDYTKLSSFKLAGGSIYNAALNAAFLAAQDESPVCMPHLLSAIRTEILKSDRLIDDSQFIWPE
jgi:SpoVK/Ycf46/Vps4 family AAA+-type ATPase